MAQDNDSTDKSAPFPRLDADAQRAVMLRAAALPQQGEPPVAPEQIAAIAEELGIAPEDVRQVLAQRPEQQVAATVAQKRSQILSFWDRLGLLGLPSFLSLLVIPTGRLAWLACLGFAPFFLFALIPRLLYRLIPADKVGYAPGWQLRCPRCQHTWDAGEAGIIRVHAAGTSRLLGRCPQCGARRWLILERSPAPPSASPVA